MLLRAMTLTLCLYLKAVDKFHFLYKTLNTVNNKVYYGIHSTDTLSDGYIGSGKLLVKAIRKYGKNSFKFEIIEFFPTREEAFKAERRIVNEEVVLDKSTYNLALGGGGGGFIGKKHSDEFKALVSSVHSGKTVSAETREKIRKSKLSEDNPLRGVARTDDVKLKISNSVSGKKHRKFNPKPVIKYTQFSEKRYDCMLDASIDLGLKCSSNISKAIKSGKIAYGYFWKFE